MVRSKVVYVCAYCDKEFPSSGDAVLHEKTCQYSQAEKLGRRLYELMRMKWGSGYSCFDEMSQIEQQKYKDVASMFWGDFVAEHAQALAEFELRKSQTDDAAKQTEALRAIARVIKELGR